MLTITYLLILFSTVVVKTNVVDILRPRIDVKIKINTATCVLKIVEKYMGHSSVQEFRGNIFQIKTSRTTPTTQKYLLLKIHTAGNMSVINMATKKKSVDTSNFIDKITIYVIILEEQEDISDEILALMKHPSWNPETRFFIIIDNPESDIIMVFNVLRKYRVFDSYVILTDPDDKQVESFTWFPFETGSCGRRAKKAIKLDVCENGELSELNPGQTKLPKRLQIQCPFNLLAIVSQPYIMPAIYNETSSENKGIEIQLLQLMAEYINLSLNVHPLFSYDQGLMEDGYSSLNYEGADVVAGNLLPELFNSDYDIIIYYLQDHLTWCVPVARTLAFWENSKYIFTYGSWILMGATAALVSIVVLYLSAQRKASISFLQCIHTLFAVCSMMLGRVTRFNYDSCFLRLTFVGWLVICVITNVIIQSSLRSFIVHPHTEKQFESFEDILQIGMPFGGHGIHIKKFDTSDKNNAAFVRTYHWCKPLQLCIERVSQGDFAIAAPLSYMRLYQQKQLAKISRTDIHCFVKEPWKTYSPMIFLWKHYPHRVRMQNIADRVFESGLLFKWYSEIITHKFQQSDEAIPRSTNKPLDINEYQAVGLFYAFSISLSVIVFVFEMFFSSLKKICVNAIHNMTNLNVNKKKSIK